MGYSRSKQAFIIIIQLLQETVASGGARQPFETYLAINYVDGIEEGVYRYLPLEHKLVYLFKYDNMIEKLTDSALEQDFAGKLCSFALFGVQFLIDVSGDIPRKQRKL